MDGKARHGESQHGSGLVGCWHADMTTLLSLSWSEKGVTRCVSKDRPIFKFLSNAIGNMCPSLAGFDLWREKGMRLILDEDLSKATLFLEKEQIREWFLQRGEQDVLSVLCPFGRSRMKLTSLSHSDIRWQVILPHQLATLHGSWELTSDNTSTLSYETSTGQHVVSFKLHRVDDGGKNAMREPRTQRRSYMPSCESVPEEAATTSTCRAFRT